MAEDERRETSRGIAAATALVPAPMPSAPGKTSYTANASVYRGQLGIGVSFAHRANTEDPFAVTFGVSHAGGKNTAVRAGVAGEF
jgi:hypothetical protein